MSPTYIKVVNIDYIGQARGMQNLIIKNSPQWELVTCGQTFGSMGGDTSYLLPCNFAVFKTYCEEYPEFK